jgi:C1A family cysteine protease
MPQARRAKAKPAKRAKRPARVKRVLNVVPSRETEGDWQFEHADAAGLLAAPAAIPKSKDLREAWWPVGDQKSTGSCVGWATADSLLRWHFVKAGRIKQTETLSKRFTWMASKETDEFESAPTTFIENAGTSLKAALDVARKFGAVKENVLPFDSGVLYPGQPETFYALAAQLKIEAYFNLSLNRGGSLDAWRRWIATKGPILTRLDVDRTWDDATANKGNLDVYKPSTKRGGHAVSLVGYTPDRFIVRNSWGTSGWGDKGFGYASPAYAKEAFTEAYGISVSR